MSIQEFKSFIPEDNSLVNNFIENLNEKISFSTWVRKQKSKKKFEDRILVITNYRLITIGKRKAHFKYQICRNIHFFSLKEINVLEEKKIQFIFEKFILLCFSDKIPQILQTIFLNFSKFGTQLSKNRTFKFTTKIPEISACFNPEPFVASGFVNLYRSWCNYYQVSPNEEFIKYILNEILNHELESQRTIFNLSNFQGVNDLIQDTKMLSSLIKTLKYNKYFEGFIVDNILKKDTLKSFTSIFKTNSKISKVIISGAQNDIGFAELGKALANNPSININYLDLSLNNFPESAMSSGFYDGISQMKSSLTHLDLSFCQMNSSSISKLFSALSANPRHKIITYLNLSHNNFGESGSSAFANWLKNTHQLYQNENSNENISSKHKFLEYLNLSNCSLKWNIVSQAIADYLSTDHLLFLDLSQNRIQKNSLSSILNMIKKLTTIKFLNLSKLNLIRNSAAQVLSAILSNSNLSGICLNLSGNRLGSTGAESISKIFESSKESNSLEELVIDDCFLKPFGLAILVQNQENQENQENKENKEKEPTKPVEINQNSNENQNDDDYENDYENDDENDDDMETEFENEMDIEIDNSKFSPYSLSSLAFQQNDEYIQPEIDTKDLVFNQSLKRISISRSFLPVTKKKEKHMIEYSFSKLFLQNGLECLRIRGSLNQSFPSQIQIFGSIEKTRLKKLDISQNKLGEILLKQLSQKISNVNCKIQILKVDNNDNTIMSLQEFVYALQNNPNFYYLDWPKEDVKKFLQGKKKKVKRAKEHIQKLRKTIKNYRKNENTYSHYRKRFSRLFNPENLSPKETDDGPEFFFEDCFDITSPDSFHYIQSLEYYKFKKLCQFNIIASFLGNELEFCNNSIFDDDLSDPHFTESSDLD
ncbi:leucine-rich repeat isoform f [Anaeramoeba ignava]|uniref:Leucine-rich repeat isoform f n=1 Tax=Anaeramoeba ignava TaxID=1746090 RepID=A0A9Q0LQS0_ANAIG|nr:leucine-rich repeat isoform f [Anaeramoeba ignava]